MPNNNKITAMISAMKLIKEVFPDTNMAAMKSLSSEDRAQLASAIARQQGLTATDVAFELVSY